MNSQVNGKPAVKSCMITWDQIDEIVKYGLAERHALNGEWLVIATPKVENTAGWGLDSFMWAGTKEEYGKKWLDSTWDDSLHDGRGGWVENENADSYRRKNWEWRTIYVFNAQPHVGGRNVHAFSGRHE